MSILCVHKNLENFLENHFQLNGKVSEKIRKIFSKIIALGTRNIVNWISYR